MFLSLLAPSSIPRRQSSDNGPSLKVRTECSAADAASEQSNQASFISFSAHYVSLYYTKLSIPWHSDRKIFGTIHEICLPHRLAGKKWAKRNLLKNILSLRCSLTGSYICLGRSSSWLLSVLWKTQCALGNAVAGSYYYYYYWHRRQMFACW